MADTPEVVTYFWSAFNDPTVYEELEYTGPEGSIAADVIHKYNLPLYSSSATIGGNLTNLDIKQMDALSVIKLSLLEELGDSGDLYEVSVNSDGEVEFIEIGAGVANLNDIYYQVQTATYKHDCVGVLVTGGRPLPTRKVMDWKPIWERKDGTSSKNTFDVTPMVTNCTAPNFSTHAMILFDNPHLVDSGYNDGIDNLYEITNPFETILGYASIIDAPNITEDTKISYRDNDTVVPIQLGSSGTNPNMGTLLSKKKAASPPELGPDCWTVIDGVLQGDKDTAIKVDIPSDLRYETLRKTTVDKFNGIEQVLIVGYELEWMNIGIKEGVSDFSNITPENCILHISSSNVTLNTYKLEPGKHYTVLYLDSEDDSSIKIPYIQFGKDTHSNDVLPYGQNTEFMVRPGCALYSMLNSNKGIGAILPCANNKGYLVEQIWVLARFNSPSILVFDPEYNASDSLGQQSKAIDIANNLVYYVAPLILYEPPPTRVFKGEVLDLTDSVADKDPTTTQDFTDTALERAAEVMATGLSLDLTFPFILDDEVLKTLSTKIEDMINDYDGVETTYVCGPNANPELGAYTPDGGVVNSITYSYTDSGSYTISVNAGPKFLGVPSSAGGPAAKAVESVSCRGTVIQDLGNHIHYKVRLDGFGDRIAINTTSNVIRVGDTVACSVHNNPVEG